MNKKYFIFILNFIFIINLSLQTNYFRKTTESSVDYDWAIVGGGAGGIIILSVLLELGISPKSILWVDSEFKVGRLGKYYANVPANSDVESIINFIKACKTFMLLDADLADKLKDLDKSSFPDLSCVVDLLQIISDELLKRVNYKIGYINKLEYHSEDDLWNVFIDTSKIKSKNVILATGSKPRVLNYSNGKEVIPLDLALDKFYLKENISKNDSVAVFGGAHSAILIIKCLYETGVNKIVNIYKTPIIYAYDLNTLALNSPNGLRGLAAQWAREILESENPPKNIFRYRTEDRSEIEELIKDCNKIIYAVGYERNSLPNIIIDSENIENESFNPDSGIIGPRLFGIGIAFPGVNEKGESLIGINSFMKYAQGLAPNWIKRVLLNNSILKAASDLIYIEIL